MCNCAGTEEPDDFAVPPPPPPPTRHTDASPQGEREAEEAPVLATPKPRKPCCLARRVLVYEDDQPHPVTSTRREDSSRRAQQVDLSGVADVNGLAIVRRRIDLSVSPVPRINDFQRRLQEEQPRGYGKDENSSEKCSKKKLSFNQDCLGSSSSSSSSNEVIELDKDEENEEPDPEKSVVRCPGSLDPNRDCNCPPKTA